MSDPLCESLGAMNTHFTEIAYILDRSGSMHHMQEACGRRLQRLPFRSDRRSRPGTPRAHSI